MNKVTLLPKWVLPGTIPSVYDTESGTCIEMTNKVYGAMRDLQEKYNSFVDEINKTITDFITSTEKNQEEFLCKITKIVHDYIRMIDEKIKLQDSTINEAVNYMKTNLSSSLYDLLVQMRESGELGDVVLEVFDGFTERVIKVETAQQEFDSRITELENKNTYFSYDAGSESLNLIINEGSVE